MSCLGCDTGFGHQLAVKLDKLGYTVFAACLAPEGVGAKQLKAKGSQNLLVISLDVSADESVNRAVTEVKSYLSPNKKLFAIVNNAGIGHYSGVDWSKPGVDDVYRSQLEVNTLGAVRVTKSFLPLLRETENSRIIIVASLAARFVFPGLVGYSMSKYAVRAFGDGLRREQKPYGINVSVIEPVMYNTSLTDMSVCLNNMKAHWDNTPEDVKQSIGSTRFVSLCKTVESFLMMRRSNVEEVLDAMIDSLTREEPKPFYRVGGLKERITLYLLEALPEELQDFFLDPFVFDHILKYLHNSRQ
ncbi:retinol dehydrogenase 3-like protein [Dinothrombium tinctorium]|uniref:Retinol dehydrogenase 3-like protein n=1 Tax=Dinothrombium tinctorium TaxID=1965070 RepID=A0A3S3PEM7_9ACAR|nr:retinol dehydrogenase 3-like protein [Dinothrombium tinctorium]RWS15246.1 retinol dehydrogenase 3-like protein [Dinothrombium tinctorium]RWS15530.1 retinol dehydrogenase 3-like protein [Dinothrombium tinctorium]